MQDEKPTVDESELIRRIQSGAATTADGAFESLVLHHTPRLLRYLAATKGLASQECAEVANDSWSRAWQLIDRYEYRGPSFFPWLRAIADNVVHEHRRRYVDLSHDDIDKYAETVEARSPTTEEEAVRNGAREEALEAIRSVLPDAPENYRAVIECLLADFTPSEIMEFYGWPRTTVDTTTFRARAWLRKRLMEQYGREAFEG